MDIIASIIILITCIVCGIPVFAAFGATAIFLVVLHDYAAFTLLGYAYSMITARLLLAIPFFILTGELITVIGGSERLINFANDLVGRVKGALGGVMVVACGFFGACSAAAAPAVAAIGTAMIPRMEKEGYPRGYSSALVSCASVLSHLIPPSGTMIGIAWLTQQSVAACFLAGIGPGILIMLSFFALNRFLTRKMPIAVTESPPGFGLRQRAKEIGLSAWKGLAVLMVPVIILGGIYGGIMTPTEAGVVSTVYCILVGLFIYRNLGWKSIFAAFRNGLTTTGLIVVMFFTAMVLSRIYITEGVPQDLSAVLLGITTNYYIILLLVNVLLLIIGMIMDPISAVVLMAPILMPILVELGVHPIHVAAILSLNLATGSVTPPTAPILYLGAAVGGTNFREMLKPTMILTAFGSLPIMLVVTYFPAVSLFLPRLIMGIE